MARLTRLALAGQAHLVVLIGLPGLALFVDDTDRQRFLAALAEAAQRHHVAIHAYALLDRRVCLLASPNTAEGLSQMVQGLGRRYVANYNRRHGRRGGLWDGRYRATIVQPGTPVLDAMLLIDEAAVADGAVAAAAEHPWSSARHHLGQSREPLLVQRDEYWQLGNTPFEREEAYRRRLFEGLGSARSAELAEAMHKGWAIGEPAFLAALAEQAGRPVQPRRRGRPPKTPAA